MKAALAQSALAAMGVAAFTVLCAPSAAAQPAEEPLNIGSRLELFVDDYLIETMTNVTQVLHEPQPREIVLETNKPWEGPWSGYFTVFQDGDLYRMYYRGMPQGGPESTCYAESRDGINWIRPNLGLFEFKGSKENNIIWTSDIPGEGGMSHNFAPFKDTNPAARPDEQYKAVTKGPLIAMCSPDGIHWRRMRDEPIITEGAFDSLNVAFWDELRQEYVCYLRDFKDGVRHIRVCTSKDFLNWTKPEWLDFGDAPPQHLYTNAIRPYFRAPHIYMGFPKRFVPERTSEIDKRFNESGISDGVFMTSRDQIHFHRWLEAFVRPGLDPGNWMQRTNMAAWGMLQTSPEEISMYYSEHYYQDSHRIRRRTLRTDGFVSINAKYSGGELLTKPVVFDGRELVINYSTSAVGSVRVEIQDAAGNAIEGFTLAQCPEIFGDESEHVVAWEGGSDVSTLAGQPVRLRFVMRDADLYSIRFRP